MARVGVVLGMLDGCESEDEPAAVPVPPVQDACTGECRPGEWRVVVRDTQPNAEDSFADSHDNLCGCPAVTDGCNALSAGLSPSPGLEEIPVPSPDPGL